MSKVITKGCRCWNKQQTEKLNCSDEISRVLDSITPVLSDETSKAWPWYLSMQLPFNLHILPSSCGKIPTVW